MTPARDIGDASKLNFPLQLVVLIVSTAGVIYASQYGLRSDVRDIRTRMELQVELDAAQAKLQEERANAMREAVADMRRRQELQQFEIQGLSRTITAMEQRLKP